MAQSDGRAVERTAADWLRAIADVRPPHPAPDGVILGPERVRVKVARRQQPLRFGSGLLGWIEVFERPVPGTLTLSADALRFRPAAGGSEEVWMLSSLKGIQPASSSLQLALPGRVASVRFPDTSVRLWARALADAITHDCHRRGLRLIELQPCLRTCASSQTPR